MTMRPARGPSPRGLRIRAAAVVLVVLGAMPAAAQDQPAASVDIVDIWNRIRSNTVVDGGEQPPTSMKAVAPVIGAKPTSGLIFGVAGNVAFINGDPRTTHISSVVGSLTFSARKQTSLSARYGVLMRDDRWRLDGDGRAQWTSQDTYALGTSANEQTVANAKFDFFRIHRLSIAAYRRACSWAADFITTTIRT